MHASLHHLDHRPWPLPTKRWLWRQSWCDLLFAHWQVPANLIQPLIPEPLELEVEDGLTWLGIVPFKMVDVAARGLPPLPWLSVFPEINVRVYVTYQDKPGVWFLSLDATQPVAVWAAQTFFHLPYYRARISMSVNKGRCRYQSERRRKDLPGVFRGEYEPVSQPYLAKPGTVEHQLTERYCLYAQAADGRLFRTQVHHQPWPLQKAEAALESDGLVRSFGLSLKTEPAMLHFSKRVDVITWNPERLKLH